MRLWLCVTLGCLLFIWHHFFSICTSTVPCTHTALTASHTTSQVLSALNSFESQTLRRADCISRLPQHNETLLAISHACVKLAVFHNHRISPTLRQHTFSFGPDLLLMWSRWSLQAEQCKDYPTHIIAAFEKWQPFLWKRKSEAQPRCITAPLFNGLFVLRTLSDVILMGSPGSRETRQANVLFIGQPVLSGRCDVDIQFRAARHVVCRV